MAPEGAVVRLAAKAAVAKELIVNRKRMVKEWQVTNARRLKLAVR
jgi:hypothetical protein